jgi:hypothetical protein
MASLFGPNAKYYTRGLDNAFQGQVEDYQQTRKTRQQVNSGLRTAKTLADLFQPVARAAPMSGAAVNAVPTVGGGLMSTMPTAPSLLTGAGSLTGVAAPATAGLGAAGQGVGLGTANLMADAGLMAGEAASGAITPVATSLGTTGVNTGLGAGAALGAGGTALGEAGATAGTAIGGAASGLSAAGVAGGVLGAAGMGYNLYNKFAGGNYIGGVGSMLHPGFMVADMAMGLYDLFSGPDKETERLKKEQSRLEGLRKAMNMQKGIDSVTGRDNDRQDE